MLKDLKSNYKVLAKLVERDGGSFLKIKTCDYLLANNTVITREELVKRDAVVILPITDDNKVLLVVQPRVFTKDGVSVELPAGYIDGKEKPEDAARRELLEETGYEAKELLYLGYHYQDQGCSRAIVHSFVAFNVKKIKEQQLDHDEYVKYYLETVEEAFKMIDENIINDSNSVVTLLKGRGKNYV